VDLVYAREPVPLTGGFWAELLAFSLADPPLGWPRDLVARVMPDPSLARKETIVQAAVSAAGYQTPVVRASGGPGDGLGRAFMVMDRASGAPLMPGLNGIGALVAGLRQLARIPEALASAMAALHALDPLPVREQLTSPVGVPITLGGMLDYLRSAAAQCQRDDLASAASWLIDHPRPPEPEVICHGDLHPFNALVAGGHITVLDWSACLLAPRAYDVAFTVSLLSEPPLNLPGPLRSLARRAGRLAASRFVGRYQALAAVSVDRDDLRWHRAVISLRSLVEVATWVHDGVIDERAGHPWLTTGPALAAHLTTVTGVPVRPR
jgi:aminoglycoside phosphotransferase (APT) family kinase protein